MAKIILIFLYATACCTLAYLDHEFHRTPVGDAVDTVSMKLLKEAYAEADEKNVVSSPLGALLLLSLYSAGAGGSVRDEIISVLRSSDYNELLESYSDLSSRFASMDDDYLTLANKVYVATGGELVQNFSDTAVRSYQSEVEAIDFSNPAAAAAIINQWSDAKTKGHIKTPVAATDLDPGTVAALVNVIFFQGHWSVPFNASETVDKDFHVDKSTTVRKPTMRLEQSLFYTESSRLGAKLVELPYKEHGFRMVVVLPNEVDGLPSVLEKAAQYGLLTDVFALEPAGRDVNLEMPKFEIKNKLDLNSLLPKVGVSKLFTQPATGIVKGMPVVVDKAFQEAFVKVDEEGATAGAFTGLVIVPVCSICGPPPPMDFKVDHPFLFAILHEDVVLFVGTYTH